MALVVMILSFKNWVLTKDLRVEHGFKHVFFLSFIITVFSPVLTILIGF